MLLPLEWAILTLPEAQLLIKFIEEQTATKGLTKNYEKMNKLGVAEIYNKLNEFVASHKHYEDNLKYFDPSDYVRDYGDG